MIQTVLQNRFTSSLKRSKLIHKFNIVMILNSWQKNISQLDWKYCLGKCNAVGILGVNYLVIHILHFFFSAHLIQVLAWWEML